MKPATVFHLELASSLSGPRLILMRLGLAFLVGAPFIFVDMPPRVKVAGLVTLIIFTTFFGAAVGVTRARAEGRLVRLDLLPTPRWMALADIILANAVIDILQTAPLIALFILINSTEAPTAVIPLASYYCATVILLNIAGVWIGWLMKSNPEVHLIGGLSVGAVAFVSGLFPVPERVSWVVDFFLPWNPVSRLARLLEQTALGGGGGGAENWIGAAILMVVVCLLFQRFFFGGTGFRSRKAPL